MSFFQRVGHFITGSQESLNGLPEEGELALTAVEQSYLEQSCNALLTASLIEDRRASAAGLLAFAKLHLFVGILD